MTFWLTISKRYSGLRSGELLLVAACDWPMWATRHADELTYARDSGNYCWVMYSSVIAVSRWFYTAVTELHTSFRVREFKSANRHQLVASWYWQSMFSCNIIGTLEDDRTALYKTKSLDSTKLNANPKTNPNPKLTIFSFMLFTSTVPWSSN